MKNIEKTNKPVLNQLNSVILPSENAIEFTTEIDKQYSAFPVKYEPTSLRNDDGKLEKFSLDIRDRHDRPILTYHQEYTFYKGIPVPELNAETLSYFNENIPTNLHNLTKYLDSNTQICDLHVKDLKIKLGDVQSQFNRLNKENVENSKYDESLEKRILDITEDKSTLTREKEDFEAVYNVLTDLRSDIQYALDLRKGIEKKALKNAQNLIYTQQEKELRKKLSHVKNIVGTMDKSDFLNIVEPIVSNILFDQIKDEFEKEEKRQKLFKK